MEIKLLSSPLQGFTDYIFRNAFDKYFGGIGKFYAPYIRLRGKLEIKSSQIKDIDQENNKDIYLIPQIMTKSVDEFLFIANFVKNHGYDELNWNLGCPYPMVARRGLGSGQIKDIDGVERILDEVFTKADIKISIKTRLGYESPGEIFQLLPVFDKYPIENIIIHPRIGKQLYKGELDLDYFQKCLESTNHKIIYNGDITSLDKFQNLQNRFNSVNQWMIGRGMIANPFLPCMIKNANPDFLTDKNEIFRKFHEELFEKYSQQLSGDKHIIMKMFQFWKYFISIFPNNQKDIKMIKKAKNTESYQIAVKQILNL